MITTEKLHSQVWTRFVRMPYGHILDNADPNGNTVIPTAEECQKSIPNVLGWATSIENGAFFSGLYLYGLCERYDHMPGEKLAEEITVIANGLLLLCDIGKQDGFIARGVADDGVSHYPFSSEDQFGPWLLGLCRLLRSNACTEAYGEEIRQRLVRSVRGVLAANMEIPTEWEGVTRGSYARRDWRGAAKGTYTMYVAKTLGLVSQDEYLSFVEAKPENGIFTRLEIISHGFGADMVRTTGLIQFWIDVCAHLMTDELITLDKERADSYSSGIFANGVICSEFIGDYRRYNELAGKPFVYDWRLLFPNMRPWTNADEAVAEAGRQIGEFNSRICPAMYAERGVLLQAVTGAWIASVCGDTAIENAAYGALSAMADEVDWNGVGMSYVAALEAAIYTAECWEETF